MAETVLTDCFISVDGVDFSGNNTNVAISESAEALDATAMGDTTRKNIGGVKDWSLAAEFVADEATTGVLHDKVGTVVPIIVRAKSAVASASNPAYQGDGLITEYQPISGEHGSLQKVSITVVSAGPLSRVTT